MFNIALEKDAKKEFMKFEKDVQKLLADKIMELKKGILTKDKTLSGKHKCKFRKKAGNYRIIYLKQNEILLITLIRITHRKEVY